MKTIYLLRHGETVLPPGYALGRREVPLSDRGRTQMQRLGQLLRPHQITRLVASPLGRCRESAELLGLDLPLQLDNDLAELDLGTWDGLSFDEVRHRFPEDYAARGRDLAAFRPPGGESFQDLLARAWQALERIRQHLDQTAVVVAHAGVNRVLLCRILGLPLQQLFQLGQDHACLNRLDCPDDTLRCRSINWTAEPRGTMAMFRL